jgi:citrate synthase
VPDAGIDSDALLRMLADDARPLDALALAVPGLAAADGARFGQTPETVLPRARALIRRMPVVLALRRDAKRVRSAIEAPSMARSLAALFGRTGERDVVEALDLALVLLADHELNASTFGVRVAASTGADVYACVQTGLAVLSGPRHGGAVERVGALLDEAAAGAGPDAVVRRLRRGESLPGFGHPLYPDGDPRTGPLLAAAERVAPDEPMVMTCRAVVAAARDAGHPAPTVDVGLAALAAALRLEFAEATGIFAIARSAGWVAHALEQAQTGVLLRPRARPPLAEPLG